MPRVATCSNVSASEIHSISKYLHAATPAFPSPKTTPLIILSPPSAILFIFSSYRLKDDVVSADPIKLKSDMSDEFPSDFLEVNTSRRFFLYASKNSLFSFSNSHHTAQTFYSKNSKIKIKKN